MPDVIMIAGPNGAGKTTSAPILLQRNIDISDFVNADAVAQGLSAFQPEKAAIQAGRIMLERIHSLAKKKESFAFETTLASRTFYHWILGLKEKGYCFHLIFLFLESSNLAVSRVSERMRLGGHFVPEMIIRRRYEAGLKNFFSLYQPIADSWQLYDNSGKHQLSLIASEARDQEFSVKNKEIWKNFLERYHEKK